MRIVSGIYGGRRLESPKDKRVRPTSDKVRGAIFNALHSRGCVEGAVVLDLCCGSGALGLEALSRGANYCVFVDSERSSLDLARRNGDAFGVENGQYILGSATSLKAIRYGVGAEVVQGGKAGLVFLDPPYDRDLVVPCLVNLHEAGLIADGAVVVVEAEKGFSGMAPACYEMLDERVYGDSKVLFLLYSFSP